MKLRRDQHAEVAKHLHAADHHLLKVLKIMSGESGHAKVPVDIITDIEAPGRSSVPHPGPPAMLRDLSWTGAKQSFPANGLTQRSISITAPMATA
jgi:hypothetical protein